MKTLKILKIARTGSCRYIRTTSQTSQTSQTSSDNLSRQTMTSGSSDNSGENNRTQQDTTSTSNNLKFAWLSMDFASHRWTGQKAFLNEQDAKNDFENLGTSPSIVRLFKHQNNKWTPISKEIFVDKNATTNLYSIVLTDGQEYIAIPVREHAYGYVFRPIDEAEDDIVIPAQLIKTITQKQLNQDENDNYYVFCVFSPRTKTWYPIEQPRDVASNDVLQKLKNASTQPIIIKRFLQTKDYMIPDNKCYLFANGQDANIEVLMSDKSSKQEFKATYIGSKGELLAFKTGNKEFTMLPEHINSIKLVPNQESQESQENNWVERAVAKEEVFYACHRYNFSSKEWEVVNGTISYDKKDAVRKTKQYVSTANEDGVVKMFEHINGKPYPLSPEREFFAGKGGESFVLSMEIDGEIIKAIPIKGSNDGGFVYRNIETDKEIVKKAPEISNLEPYVMKSGEYYTGAQYDFAQKRWTQFNKSKSQNVIQTIQISEKLIGKGIVVFALLAVINDDNTGRFRPSSVLYTLFNNKKTADKQAFTVQFNNGKRALLTYNAINTSKLLFIDSNQKTIELFAKDIESIVPLQKPSLWDKIKTRTQLF